MQNDIHNGFLHDRCCHSIGFLLLRRSTGSGIGTHIDTVEIPKSQAREQQTSKTISKHKEVHDTYCTTLLVEEDPGAAVFFFLGDGAGKTGEVGSETSLHRESK